jgi:TRAP transporter TAXI family solute receptor
MKRIHPGMIFLLMLVLVGSILTFSPNVHSAQKYLIVGGGNTGGLYYPMAGVFANLINKHIKGYRASAEVTGASVDNCIYVGERKMDIGFSNADTILYANQGKKPQFNKKYDLYALFETFTSCVQVYVLKNSPVKSVADLKGKRISVGSPGSATIWKAKVILGAYGLTFDDIKPAYLTFGEGVDALIDRNIDATFQFLQPRSSALIDLTTRADVKVLPYSDAIRDKILTEHPYLKKGTVPGGVLRGIPNDVPVIASGNPCFVQREFPVDLAYQFTKVIYDNLDYIYKVLPILEKELTPADMTSIPKVIPMHPGAVKFFKEKGMMK